MHMSYKTIDGLMRHLRSNGIAISGSVQKRQLINTGYYHRYIYALKDLRNAIAHNAVVFDTRFRTFDPSKAMSTCLKSAIGLPYVNFKTIGDYLILMCYYLKLLHTPQTEINAFIRDFTRITETYRNSVDPAVSAIVIHPDLPSRMNILKNYI